MPAFILGLVILALALVNLLLWIKEGNLVRAIISLGLVALTHYSLFLRWRALFPPRKPS